MNKLLLLIFMFLSSFSFGQIVTVKGIAVDSTNGRHKVFVVLNDTLYKFYKSKNYDSKTSIALRNNKDYRVKVDDQNRFQIKAKLTDSLTFSSWKHIKKSFLVSDLMSRQEIKIILKPEVCIEYVECEEENPKLYVFVGEKISVDSAKKEYYCNISRLDYKYEAKYKILENLYGDYKNDTINFVAYDHYGDPSFSSNKNIILYVVEYCDQLYHLKYQYALAYKTKDGRWASPPIGYDYKKFDSLNLKRPVEIEYQEEVIFEMNNLGYKDSLKFKKVFREPFFEINGSTAKAIYGNYAVDVFERNKKGILKREGFFE